MNILRVVRFGFIKDYQSLAAISAGLDDLDSRHRIDILNWKEYNYRPDVKFSIAHNGSAIFIKYYVRENYVKAEKTRTNDSVSKDSCVEFFVAPANDGMYYNFEFNSIGTCLAGSGTGRHDSKTIDPALADKIARLPDISTKPFAERKGDIEWTLTVAIPVELLFRHETGDLGGQSFRANFYKCGDELSRPHYLTWNPVAWEKPDFHRPESFGLINFE